MQGTIRPEGATTININRTVEYTAAKAAKLTSEAPPAARQPTSGTPGWVWIALAAAAALLIALPVSVWKLARKPARAVV